LGRYEKRSALFVESVAKRPGNLPELPRRMIYAFFWRSLPSVVAHGSRAYRETFKSM
jgi:hypothetical protein